MASRLRRRFSTLFPVVGSAGASGLASAAGSGVHNRVGTASAVAAALAVGSSSGGGGPPTDDPGNPFWSNDFTFTATLQDSAATHLAAFLNNGFDQFKDEITQPTRARGYLYTVSSIPGHASTPIPTASGRALCINAMPLGGQTDFYFHIGTPGNVGGYFPPELWWECWFFSNRTGSEMSEYDEGKLFYWLESSDPDHQFPGSGFADVGRSNIRVNLWDAAGNQHATGYQVGGFNLELLGGPSAPGVPRLHVAAQVGNAPQRMSPNFQDGNREWLPPNQWRKFRFHKSIGQANARFRCWTRDVGETDENFHLVHDTQVSGVTYVTALEDRLGASALRCPTTFGPTSGSNLAYWLYMARLRFASTEAGLGVQRTY